MSKARTLADFISDGSEFADGTISVAEVSGAAPLASPTFTGNVDLGDNVRIRLGDSDDLQIYHDRYNSYIEEQGSGNLFIRGTNHVYLQNSAGTKTYFAGNDPSGWVRLYHDNNKKFETTSTGIDVAGDVGATTATITGKTTTDELDLNALAATISDTAVDVFVYDTRKDSDGGAWRKRTQGTSWYNETLNTATRGSRKEFPSVAVIVAESNQVTIYDGDDPDLPMWMVFNSNTLYMLPLNISGGGNATAITALNGELSVVQKGGDGHDGGLNLVNFIKDGCIKYRNNTSVSYSGNYKGNIAERNSGKSWDGGDAQGIVVDDAINDVAMTVLPNAPIDAATGLPVPTIAVGTAGGISVIRDDGTVVDENTGQNYDFVSFDQDRLIGGRSGGGTNEEVRCWFYPTYLSDSFAFDVQYKRSLSVPSLSSEDNSDATQAFGGSYIANGIPSGLNIINQDLFHKPNANSEKGDIAYITSTYNTGWMNGDIKLATLSDTDDTDVTGSELVTNGTFDSDLSGWTANNATLSVDAGRLKIVDNGSSASAYQVITVEAGKTYTFVATMTAGTAAPQWYITPSGGSLYVIGSNLSDGTHAYTYTVPSGVTSVTLAFNNTNGITGQYMFVDNVSVRLAEEDRSVNGNGLQVFGTVTKNPVATGADLVAYSAGSNGDGLVQPHNTDLEFGTGDFCFMFWGKQVASPTVNGKFVALSATNATGTTWVGSNINIDVNNVGLVKVFLTNDAYASNDQVELNADGADGTWYCYALVRRGNTFYGYKNGELNESVAVSNASGSLTNTDSRVHVLIDPRRAAGNTGYGSQTDVDIALLRISATAPSPEQIARIYNDEKHLFTEGAQATLYGSSDSVTALAYDTDSELLHVGTSAGRSVFQGLRRVDNTTTAVTSAISASNGLVADE